MCWGLGWKYGMRPLGAGSPCWVVRSVCLSICGAPQPPWSHRTTSTTDGAWSKCPAQECYPKTNKPNLLIQLRLLKITSSQTFISKVEFHVKWKYLLKPYVHICMIQTATTVQHSSLNFNQCTPTFSSKRNIVTVTPQLLWSFLMKLQSVV